MTSYSEPHAGQCPWCGGATERDHCVEPGKRPGKIGCGWWKLAAEVTDGLRSELYALTTNSSAPAPDSRSTPTPTKERER